MNAKELGSKPAYPFPVPHGSGAPTGLTKREAFAMAAMPAHIAGMSAADVGSAEAWHAKVSELCARSADALLAELAKEPNHD